jgi:hypothetical protein
MLMRALTALIVASVAAPSVCDAQSVVGTDSLVRELQSADPVVRATAFEQLRERPGVFQGPITAVALLQLLQREDPLIAATFRESNPRVGVGERFGEDWGVYHAHLLEDCLRVCSKADVLALLLRNTQSDLVEVRFDATGLLGGAVRQAFAPQQREMIDSVLGVVAADPAAMVRSAALGAMAGIAESPSSLVPSQRSRFHRAAVAAVEDASPGVRRAAVELLGAVGTASDAGTLRDLAQRDSFASVNRGVKSFPVRDAARQALTRLHLQ